MKPDSLLERPALDPRLAAIVQNQFTTEVFVSLGGGMKYAGDEKNPRALPQTTLSDLKRDYETSLQGAHRRQVRHIPRALCLAFYADKFKPEGDSSVSVPRADLWWLVQAGDTVLLSDRITHHYTAVHRVDRELERIYFLDPWPDRFFLKEGLNAAGVAACFDEGQAGLRITRQEFHRVIVGLITKDTPELFDAYFTAHPDRRASYETNLGIGLSLLDIEREEFARYAVPYLKTALRVAEENGLPDRVKEAASKLFLALNVASYCGRMKGDSLCAKPFDDELKLLNKRFPPDKQLAALRVDDICRIANAAGNAKEFGEAKQLFDVAVGRDPKHEQARRLRAGAKYAQRDFEGAVEDIGVALAANARAVERLKETQSARDPRDRFGIARDDSGLAGLRTWRLGELATRCAARIALGQLDLARNDAAAMRKLAPDKSDGYVKLGLIDRKAGRFEGARQHFQAALDLEKEPRLRAMLTNALREIEKDDVKAGSTGFPENDQ